MVKKRGHQLSTINQNCRRTRKVNHYQQLSTMAEGQERSTIINNYQQWQKDKKGQPLSTINNNFFRSFSRDYCDSQCEHCEQPN